MEIQKLHIVLEEAETVMKLKQQLSDALERYTVLEKRMHHIEQKFGEEVYLNNELVSLCRVNGISFKKHMEHKERERMKAM